MINWTVDKERLQQEAQKIDSSIKLITKDGLFWKMIAWVLFIFSFGHFKQETFLKVFATTLGNYQAYPKEWSIESVESVMIHESRHTYQARLCGFGTHPLAGLPIMALLYIFLPFPILIAFPRFFLELDAEKAAWRYGLKKGTMSPNDVRLDAQRLANLLSSSAYLWPVWNSFAKKYYMAAAEEIIKANI